jgi:excisionase family DNA binding protein
MTTQVTLPRTQDIEAATTAQRELAAYLATGFETKLVQLVDSNDRSHPIRLPVAALQLLSEILSELADGNAVKIVPVHAELTTQEAADLLNVSRPYLVKLLETDKLSFHKTGKHRRIRFDDLMSYKHARDEKNQLALDALAAEAQELRMGYE